MVMSRLGVTCTGNETKDLLAKHTVFCPERVSYIAKPPCRRRDGSDGQQ
jgi:hypothetical protein